MGDFKDIMGDFKDIMGDFKDIMGDFIPVIIFGVVTVFMIVSTAMFWAFITLPPQSWHCTASVVVNDTLPKVERCTQYSLKEGK